MISISFISQRDNEMHATVLFSVITGFLIIIGHLTSLKSKGQHFQKRDKFHINF